MYEITWCDGNNYEITLVGRLASGWDVRDAIDAWMGEQHRPVGWILKIERVPVKA